MSRRARGSERAELRRAIARLRSSIMAVTFGLAGGSVLFVATAWLVIRGGDTVGPHLGLLDNYFPGYSVTWPGAMLGFVYGAIAGGASGWLLAWVYNSVADRRSWRTSGGHLGTAGTGAADPDSEADPRMGTT